MSDRVLNLQQWINSKGFKPPLLPDGKWGPITRNATIEIFRNRDVPTVTERQMQFVATDLGCTLRQLRAVAAVESAGGGWDDAGLLKCLWERHWLWRRVRLAVPFLSDPKRGGYTVDADKDGVNDSWEKLADATGLFGFNVAAECASFGKFQIMGAHWKALGYRSVADFIWRLSRTEAAHYDAFARFVKANKLVGALKDVSANPETCRAFAKGYNGSAYADGNYHGRIAIAYRRS